ncbi:MAG: cyclic-di-AMP receptor [Oscillospiraceae bacterium]|nr:cyclic-di-AMP receptor [Oscillospiraceae bacterium]
MKMILAVIDKDDSSGVISNLSKEGFRVTTLSTTGGFLRAGNVTILVGVEDEKTQDVISIIKEHSRSRSRQMPALTGNEASFIAPMAVEVSVGGATIFVMNVEQFEKV